MSIGDVNGLAANAYFVLAEHDNMTSASDSDGLLGLAFNTLSDGYDTLVDSLFKVGAIKKRIFALYLNRLGQIGDKEGYGEKPSSLEIGTYNIKKYADADSLMITQDIEKSSGFWKARVNFEFMDLELKQVPVIYDSGTTLVIVDQNSYMNMFEYLIDSHTCVDYGLIICECGSRDDMPSLKFYIKGHKLEIPADRAWYSEGKYCMLLVQQANIDFWILGSLFLQNFYTIHDMDNAQITFAVAKESFSTLVAFVSMLLVL
jgi:cathepsin D